MSRIHSKAYATIIQTLVNARKNYPLTQMELAKLWDKKQPTITKIEQCERRLDMVEFLELCIILDLNPNDVLRDVHLEMKRTMLSR